MDAEAASSEVVPRYVDLALFLCGTALRNLRGELQPSDWVTVRLYRWYLQKICFVHALPNDNANGEDGDDDDEEEEVTQLMECLCKSNTSPPGTASPPSLAASVPSTHTTSSAAKEVNFKTAFSELHAPAAAGLYHRTEVAGNPSIAAADKASPASDIGRVHARSSSSFFSSSSEPVEGRAARRPRDVGFTTLEEFLGVALTCGGAALLQRVSAALVGTLTEQTELSGLVSPTMQRAAVAATPAASPSPPVHVATLSKLFDEDLLDDELCAAAGNATRSFDIWVNFEWASASFLRQTRLATVATRWLRELCLYRDGRRQPSVLLHRPAHDALQQSSSFVSEDTLSLLPTNVKGMYAALEGVFEGHTNTRKSLMEMALMQHTPQHTDNALAKLLFIQGPSIAAHMSRGDLVNRGTQPILMSITNGMLLYAQYYLSFHSLAVARQCVRVALQVAQEVHSNSILALAHYTAHTIAVHQGRPADAANSIAIALQLSLGSDGVDGVEGGSGGGTSAAAAAWGGSAGSTDGQMASVAFAGAAQLLLFFPGTVSAALRSVLSTGRLSGVGDAAAGAAGLEIDGSGTRGATEEGGRYAAGGGGGGAVSAQTVAQSIRHAVLRAETSLLHAPPTEGRWVGVIAALHRETLLLVAALYGVVSTPTAINEATLKQLCDQLRDDAGLTSPLFRTPCHRSLFWEVLRHVSHHALCLLEHLLPVTESTTKAMTGSTTRALWCLDSALRGLRVHYGPAALQVATNNVFFGCVVRYCAARHLYHRGYATAAYSLLAMVSECLCHAAGMESATAVTQMDGSSDEKGATSAVEAVAQSCWPPDHLLLFALVQRRRAEVAAFLGLLLVPPQAQQALLAVSSRYSFSYGVLTAQLMEAQMHQHYGCSDAALATARRVERSALRIGFSSLAEVACMVQITAHSSSSDWRAAQRALLRLQPRHGDHRVFLLLYQFSVHLELLLLEKRVSSSDAGVLAQNWLRLMSREGLLASPLSCSALSSEVDVSLGERLCILSTLSRAHSLLGDDVTELRAATMACLREIEERQGTPVPDVYVHGNCEEICQHGLSM